MTDTAIPADPVVVTVHDDGVAELVLNRPHRANTIDLDLARCLRSAVRDVLADPRTAAVVVTGAGPRFCCGGDIAAFSAVPDLPEHLRAVTDHLHAALAQLHQAPVPVVSAVRGDAAGAGIGVALTADTVVAAASARFTFGFATLGLSPDASTSWGLVRRVGGPAATRFALSNRTLNAAEALASGLADEVVADDELPGAAHRCAIEMAGRPRAAVIATRELLHTAGTIGVVPQMEREQESLVRLAERLTPADLRARFTSRKERRVRSRPTNVRADDAFGARVTSAGPTATLWLDAPRGNALTPELLAGWPDQVAQAEASGAALLLIRSRVAGIFSSGLDLAALDQGREDPGWRRDVVGLLSRARESMSATGMVTVALLDGALIGAAALLVTSCDLRVATPRVRVEVPVLKHGIVLPPEQLSWLVRLVGRSAARQLVLGGASWGGQEALRAGFVDEVVPPGLLGKWQPPWIEDEGSISSVKDTKLRFTTMESERTAETGGEQQNG